MRLIAVMGALVALVAACVSPTPDLSTSSASLETLADTETFVLTSSVTARTYQIFVAFPRGYDDADTLYPVVYSVDANGQFGTVVDVVRMMPEDGLPEPLVVGIGYPVGRKWNASSPRGLDLTPTSDPDAVAWLAEEYPEFPALEGSGGGPGFLRFIREELIPHVEEHYKASREGRAYYGHSFGGLFGTYALFAGDDTFSRFVLGSPSYWWDDRAAFDIEAEFARVHDSLEATVFFSVGLQEEVPGDEASAHFRMVSNLREFIDVLERRNYAGLITASEFFPAETHVSVIPATISRGLRFVFSQ